MSEWRDYETPFFPGWLLTFSLKYSVLQLGHGTPLFSSIFDIIISEVVTSKYYLEKFCSGED